MAKVTGPLMSLDASGTVGKTATFSKWKGRNYVRLRVIPRNPMSNDQAEARTKLGVIGKALSVVFFGTAPDFYSDSVAAAPAGQSWISYAMKIILGTNASTFDTNHTAYGALSGGNQTIYQTAATAIGLADFSLSYGTYGTIDAGESMYHMLSFAINFLGYTLSAGTLAAPDAGGLSDFGDYVTL